MKDSVKKFLEAASHDEELKKELAGAKTFEAMQKIAESHGYTITHEDFKAGGMEEISEDEMKAVAGGGLCVCDGSGTGNATHGFCFCADSGQGTEPSGTRTCTCDHYGFGYI